MATAATGQWPELGGAKERTWKSQKQDVERKELGKAKNIKPSPIPRDLHEKGSVATRGTVATRVGVTLED